MLDPASNLALGAILTALGLAAGWFLRGLRPGRLTDRTTAERSTEARLDLVVAQERDRSLASSAKATELGMSQRVARLEQDLGIRSAQVASLRDETARLARLRHELEAKLAQSQEELTSRGEALTAALARVTALEAATGAAGTAAPDDTPKPLPRDVGHTDERLPEHLQALDNKLREAAERAAETANAHAAALRQERTTRERLQARIAELEAQAGKLRDLELQVGDSERRRTEAVHDLEVEVRRLRARNAELESAVRQRDDLQRALQAGEVELQRRLERIRELERFLPERERRVALEAETTTLRTLLADRDREVEELRAAEKEILSARSPHPVTTMASRRRGRRRDGDRDDLQRIHGIGPVLERRLRRLGITRFGQIAQWTDEDIARIATQLEDSAERIRRDGWVQSARREHTRKYGHDPLTGDRVAEKA
jgi:predicted flap endonuclease-1-like 5' DNA nuclease